MIALFLPLDGVLKLWASFARLSWTAGIDERCVETVPEAQLTALVRIGIDKLSCGPSQPLQAPARHLVPESRATSENYHDRHPTLKLEAQSHSRGVGRLEERLEHVSGEL